MPMARRRSSQLPEYTRHVATTLPSSPDLLDQLSLEHRQIQELWADLERAHRHQIGAAQRPEVARLGDTSQMELGRRIMEALAAHEADEMNLLYPAAARVMNDEWAEEAQAEHAELRELLGAVDGENPEDEGVFAIYDEVLRRIIAHIDEEEKVVFPIMRVVLAGEELVDPRPPQRRATHTPHSAPPEVVELAAAEREMAGADSAVANGRKDKSRRKLLRR